jgi:histone demethylase JARID1
MEKPAHYEPGMHCEWCAAADDAPVVPCEGCDLAFHLHCAYPPLTTRPDDEWFCAQCLKDGEDCSFRDGNEYDLPSFQSVADEFKRNWFVKRQLELVDAANDSDRQQEHNVNYTAPNEFAVEQEFWRLAESPYENVDVEYGADLHTSIVGRCACLHYS